MSLFEKKETEVAPAINDDLIGLTKPSTSQSQVLTTTLLISNGDLVLKSLEEIQRGIEAVAEQLLGVRRLPPNSAKESEVIDATKPPQPQGAFLQIYTQLASMRRTTELSLSALSPLATFAGLK